MKLLGSNIYVAIIIAASIIISFLFILIAWFGLYEQLEFSYFNLLFALIGAIFIIGILVFSIRTYRSQILARKLRLYVYFVLLPWAIIAGITYILSLAHPKSKVGILFDKLRDLSSLAVAVISIIMWWSEWKKSRTIDNKLGRDRYED